MFCYKFLEFMVCNWSHKNVSQADMQFYWAKYAVELFMYGHVRGLENRQQCKYYDDNSILDSVKVDEFFLGSFIHAIFFVII